MVTHVDEISTPPTPADPPGVFEDRAARVWSDLARSVPQMNDLAGEIEQIGQNADSAKARAIAEADAAMGYRHEARAARDTALEHKTAAAASAGAASEHAGSAATDAVRAETAAASAENRVPTTGSTGAAIFPSGPESDRPDPAQHEGKFLVRGNADTGKLEWYDWGAQKWVEVGSANSGLPRFTPYVWGGRGDAMPAGDTQSSGQPLLDLQYPDMRAEVVATQFTCTEKEWQADPMKRLTHWSLGDDVGWMRPPDKNCVQPGAIAGAFYGVGIGPDSPLVGTAVLDENKRHSHTYSRAVGTTNRDNGAVVCLTPTQGEFKTGEEGGEQARPRTWYGIWMIRMYGRVLNEGALDAPALNARMDMIDARVGALGAIRYEPEALWVGNTGAVIELTLSREVLEGETLVLKHATAGTGLTNPQVYLPSVGHQVDGGTYFAFNSGSFNTGVTLRKPAVAGGPSVMKMLSYTSGQPIAGIYAIKQKS